MPPPSKKKLTHIDPRGEARMVDVSTKPAQQRQAVAEGAIQLSRQTIALIESNRVVKGNVLATARIAGIMAAKKTSELIPLCHPLAITHCEINFVLPRRRNEILIRSSVRITGPTGVEMEALTAVSVAALTIYDMCKAVDKSMVIGPVRLISKIKTNLAQTSKPARLLK